MLSDPETMLSIALPVHNEASTVESVLMNHFKEIASKIPSKVFVAEDGSTDETKMILLSLSEKVPLQLVFGRQRLGYAKAVSNLLQRTDADWIFFSDSDGQYSPADFWRLWATRDSFDMIVGKKTKRMDATYRIALAKGFHTLVNLLFHLGLHDADCGFRLIRRKVVLNVVKDVRFLPYSFWAEFTIRAGLKGFRLCEVPIGHNRRHGSTHIYKARKIPLILLRQITGLARLYWDIMNRP